MIEALPFLFIVFIGRGSPARISSGLIEVRHWPHVVLITAQLSWWHAVLSRLSQVMALRAGDLTMTGTPPGVDSLAPGDVINAGVDGLGELEVRVGPRRQS